MNNRLEQAIAFVRLGYGDILENASFRSLEFLTDALTTIEAQHVLGVVPKYNAFAGDTVASAIERFRGRISAYEFGRSRSPVLHVRLPFTANQAEEYEKPWEVGPRISEADHTALLAEMKGIFVNSLDAEEFEAIDDRSHYIRIWWG